ncbi:MAG TPA: butyrate kinase [bacterium]|nr:butyrate kinase [bacterium]HQI49539.1 butyrate kinase [bacterium]HQJ64717.1 butyrate kinase [bacterium]
MFKILAINPGSTSTKIALYEDEEGRFTETLSHSAAELSPFATIFSQYAWRQQAIQGVLEKRGIALEELDAFVGRGGLLRPVTSGTYLVGPSMLEQLERAEFGEHASNLGAILAFNLASLQGRPAYIVDPVVVDELLPESRLTGHPRLPKQSIFHALNHKAVARKAAAQLGKPYDQLNLVIAHLGGGISVAAHARGRVVDVNNALNGDGPFSPERSGTLPARALADLCFSGEFTEKEIARMITGQGGVVAYLGVNDMRQVVARIDGGDETALLVYTAMAGQIAKEIGSMATVLRGAVDAVILTGGIAHDRRFVALIGERVGFIAPLLLFPGEEEMEALALGALRVLRGEETAKSYEV